MRKCFFMALMLAAWTAAGAQDKVLDKYNEVDDVQKSYVSRNKLDHLTEGQRAELDIPGLEELMGRIESLRILSSDKLKAEKELRTKVPRALEKEGFGQAMRTERDGAQVTMLARRGDASRLVFVVTKGGKTTIVSVKGDFQ